MGDVAVSPIAHALSRHSRANARRGGREGLIPMGLPRRLAVLTAVMAVLLVTGATEIALWWSARTRLEDFRLESVALANTLASLLVRSAPKGDTASLAQSLEGWSRHRLTESQAIVYVLRQQRLDFGKGCTRSRNHDR